MLKFYKRHTKKIIAILLIVVLIVVISISRSGGSDDVLDDNGALRTIPTLIRSESGFEARMSLSGTVSAEQEAIIRSEATGTITALPIRVGTSVSQGAVLAQLQTRDAQNQVNQAQAQLDAAQAALRQLEEGAEGSMTAQQLEAQQNTMVNNALRALLNTDLRAYPLRNAAEERANPPSISGTYTGTEKGEYIIETYASGALSGASFRYSGLESGTQSINAFNNAVPLGTSGLFISFPQSPDVTLSNQRWVVPIPNTQSSLYGQALSAYESAIAGRDVALSQGVISDSRLDAARASVDQARAGLQAAQNQLARTSPRAPFTGNITAVSVSVGDFINAGTPLAILVNDGALYVRTFVTPREARRIAMGDRVLIENAYEGEITHIASGINPQNGKIEVHVSLPQNTSLVSGEFISLDIILDELGGDNGDGILLPLSAVQPTLQGSRIYMIDDDGLVSSLLVETGTLIGEFIEVLTPLDEDMRIAASARGLRDGMVVVYE